MAPRFTVREYFTRSETLFPQELVYGYVREAPGPAVSHQTVVGNLYTALRTHLGETGAGRVWTAPVDVVLDEARSLVVQPDVLVVLNDRLERVTDRIWCAPDLVVEVLSPQPRIGELAERIGWFARYGVRECWLVRQTAGDIEVVSFGDGQITQRRMFGDDQVIASNVLPKLRLRVSDVITLW